MIYLSKQLKTKEGDTYPMTGILPFAVEMTGKLEQFGYVTVELTDDCLLGARGTVIRGTASTARVLLTNPENRHQIPCSLFSIGQAGKRRL